MSVSKSYLSGSAKIDAKGNWALRFRLPSGKDSRKVLGPAWTHRGEAPKGYLTERDALRELDGAFEGMIVALAAGLWSRV